MMFVFGNLTTLVLLFALSLSLTLSATANSKLSRVISSKDKQMARLLKSPTTYDYYYFFLAD
jgi:hypothetical protein